MFSPEELEEFRKDLWRTAESDLPEEEELQEFLDRGITLLENEKTLYRPLDDNGCPGGLLDFSGQNCPVIIVPDIHGRTDFLLRLMDFRRAGGGSVLELLNRRELIVLCLGDYVHSEKRGLERWLASYDDWVMDVYAGPSMQQEMKENLAVIRIAMKLKAAFTDCFHLLKGNHENITNEDSGGNHSFRKFVQEGQMCCDFIRQVYGDVILHLLSIWEKSLPLCAVFDSFGASHAEPLEPFSRSRVINCRSNPQVVHGLTWTQNDEVTDSTCSRFLAELNPCAKPCGILWFGGHRPVRDSIFALRQEGQYLQLHNPSQMNAAYVVPGKKFNPKKDFIILGDK